MTNSIAESKDDEARQALLAHITARRASITTFIRDLKPRKSRLTNLSIICSAIAAILTAGPGVGGTKFTEAVQQLSTLPSDSSVWRILCLGATLLSVLAAITTNMYQSHDIAARLSSAEASHADLEGLEALVQFGQLPVTEAVKLYQQYIARIPFIGG